MTDNKEWTEEQLAEAEKAMEGPWTLRSRPDAFDPVQIRQDKITCSCIDWWNTRSNLLCCLYPCLQCAAGGCSCTNPCSYRVIDADDIDVWKKQLEAPAPNCPEPMKGVWWLRYNHAPEELVTIFNDANFYGTFNEEGTDGFGAWERPLQHNWTREQSLFGYAVATGAKIKGATVKGSYNFKEGIVSVRGGGKAWSQMVYRINDNEWWKIHYAGDPGQEGEQEITFAYKWLKVLDKDGEPTEHWNDYVEWANSPLPHQNCGTCWLPCWPMCLKSEEVLEDMMRPNPKQIVSMRR